MSDGLHGLYWWIDRWRKSTAYTDLRLEEQGAYRNLLDEQTLRGGPIPDDERILAKACGDALAWPRIRDAVLARFERVEGGWINRTCAEVNAKGKDLREKRSAAAAKGNRSRWGQRKPDERPAKSIANPIANGIANASSPDPDQYQYQYQDKTRNQEPAGKLWKFSSLYVSPKMHAIVARALGPKAKNLDFDAIYESAASDYAENGEPADKLDDLKRRARAAAEAKRGDVVPSVAETRAMIDRMEAERVPLTDAQKAEFKERLRAVVSGFQRAEAKPNSRGEQRDSITAGRFQTDA